MKTPEIRILFIGDDEDSIEAQGLLSEVKVLIYSVEPSDEMPVPSLITGEGEFTGLEDIEYYIEAFA